MIETLMDKLQGVTQQKQILILKTRSPRTKNEGNNRCYAHERANPTRKIPPGPKNNETKKPKASFEL